MPGTDAGSAPQESWHGNVLKPAFGILRRKPADVAQVLRKDIVEPQLRALDCMRQQAEAFQDWPGIGQYLDQHVLQGDTQLRKEGRTSGKSLLRWGLRQRLQDAQGNIWMLVPTSKWKADFSKKPENKKRHYKARTLEPEAIQQYVAITKATTVGEVELALSELGLYDLQTHAVKCWRTFAKALDDWRCVVPGPFSQSLWQAYRKTPDERPLPVNKHGLWLCFGCHVASLWGPCEHAYCCMEHEGQSSASPLPAAKAKGRPSRQKAAASSMRPPEQIVPGASLGVPSSASVPETSAPAHNPEHQALRAMLQSSGLTQYLQPLWEQGVTVSALQRFSFSDFWTLFQMPVRHANLIMETLSSTSSSPMPVLASWVQRSL